MGTERHRRRRAPHGALGRRGVLLLSGCASMPDDGTVDHVDSSHSADPDSQVRVFGVSPQKGERPQQIVRGFLEATTSDEATFSTAKEYLTEGTADEWDPFASTSVLSGGPSPGKAREDTAASKGYTVEVSGTRVAEVDAESCLLAHGGRATARASTCPRWTGEWRIDRLPDGLVLGESDFQRIYRPINNYYYASWAATPESITGGKNVLVADPVYLRRRIDPVTATVEALLAGPDRVDRPGGRLVLPATVRGWPGASVCRWTTPER